MNYLEAEDHPAADNQVPDYEDDVVAAFPLGCLGARSKARVPAAAAEVAVAPFDLPALGEAALVMTAGTDSP